MKKLYLSLIALALLAGNAPLLAMFGKEAGKRPAPAQPAKPTPPQGGAKPAAPQPAKPQQPVVAPATLDAATQQALQQAVDAMKAVKAAAPNDQVRKLVMDALRNAAA